MGKVILVVGGAGYIGSHMVLALKDAGFIVVVFDNLSRGNWKAEDETNFFKGDLRFPEDIDNCFSKYKFDLVMHFAAFAYVGESVLDPELYYQNNVLGTINLLSSMRKFNLNKLVFSSTCATYGEPTYLPVDEEHIQNPINSYGRSKLMIENILKDYFNAYQLQSISLRYFNAAGCDSLGRAGEFHDPETHLIPLVLLEALRVKNGGNPKNSMLKIFGSDFETKDGSCIRDYVHVEDICSAHLSAAKRLLKNETIGVEFFNLANGEGFSVFDVIAACQAVTGQSIEYQIAPRRVGDPAVLVGTANKALTFLDWNPKIMDLHKVIETAWISLCKEKKVNLHN